MNEMQIFRYGGNEIRTVEKEDGLWWVLVDVCKVLNISHIKDTADRLEQDEVGQAEVIDRLGRRQSSTIVNESGLYNVILRSDKPEAVPFRRWVTHEVLPSIRRHGAYMTPEALQAAILNPDTMISLCQQLKAEQDKSRTLEAANASLTVDLEIARPKAEYFDELCDRNLLTNFRETAKELKVPQNRLISFLIGHRYIFRDQRGKLMPYARYVESGLFEVKETFNEKTEWSGVQTLVTPKGRERLRLLCPE